ncbi:MAG: 50S ribosomal protein L24 [bacterium]
MKIRKNDKVMIVKGKDKGKTGLVLRTFPNKDMIMVDGVNQFKKHQKGEAKGRGEMITITKPMYVSKVVLIDPETDKPTKVKFVIEDGKKYRVSKKTNNKLITKVNVEKAEQNEEKPKKTKKASSKSSK